MESNVTEINDEQAKILDSLMQKQNYKQKFRWDESFQRRLVGILLTDKHFIAQSINLIKPEYFTNECHSDICKIVLKVAEKYQGSTPDRFIVENYLDELNKDKPDAVKFYYKSELDSIYDYHMANAASREILLDKLVTFAKMQSLRIAMDESQKDMKKDPDSEATWNTIFERFRNVMNVNKSFDVGFEYFQKIDDFFSELNKETTREGVFTSGFLSIDEALSGGGCRRGEIYAFIALAGKGKSLALVKAAVENIKKGYKVLFISVEMDWVSISKRFTSQYSGFAFGGLQDNQAQIKEFIEYNNINHDDKNRFVIRDFPANSIDVNDIRAFMNQLEVYGFTPDVLIVDYPGEMRDTPNIPTWESKYRMIRDLRGLAGEKKIIVFTAMQANRSSSELSSGEFIEEGNIGTSYDMYKPLDGLWSINQTTEEASANLGRIFVVKHRNGNAKFHFTIKYDKEVLNINEIKVEEYRAVMHNNAKRKAEEYGLITPDQNVQEDSKQKRRRNPSTNSDVID